MVKSQGVSAPPENITDILKLADDVNETTHALENKYEGMDVVDGAPVRLSHRQMSVKYEENKENSLPDGGTSSTFYLPIPDEASFENQQTFSNSFESLNNNIYDTKPSSLCTVLEIPEQNIIEDLVKSDTTLGNLDQNVLSNGNDVQSEATQASTCSISPETPIGDTELEYWNESKGDCLINPEISRSDIESIKPDVRNGDEIQPDTIVSDSENLRQNSSGLEDEIKVEKTQRLGHSISSKFSTDSGKETNGFDHIDARIPPHSKRMPSKDLEKEWLPTFTVLDLVLTIVGIVFFFLDVGSDWRLAIRYFNSKEFEMFGLTLGFILVPALISTLISLIWSRMDYIELKKERQERLLEDTRSHEESCEVMGVDDEKTTSCERTLLFLKVLFSLLQLGRCFRSFVYIFYVVESLCCSRKLSKLKESLDSAVIEEFRTILEQLHNERELRKIASELTGDSVVRGKLMKILDQKIKERDLKKKALEQKQDSTILGLVDGFLESALQLLLQLYLALSRQLYMDPGRIITICLSWMSTALLQTSYYRNNRKVQKNKENVRYKGSIVYLLWRLCELGPRFFLFVLFTYTVPFYVSIPCYISHFIIMVIFCKLQKPALKGICCSVESEEDNKPRSKLYLLTSCIGSNCFLLLISYINLFCYVNLHEGKTRRYALAYYVLFYLENFAIFGTVWILFPQDQFFETWKHGSLILCPGLLFHILFQTLYYQCFHPKKISGKGENNDGNCFTRLANWCRSKSIFGVRLI